MSIVTIISAIGLFILVFCQNGVAVEIQFDRIELMNDSYIEGLYNVSEFRITKFNRTTYVLNTKAEIFFDIDRDIKIQVNFHFNRLNNNQYNKTPMEIKDVLCNVLEKYYQKFVMIQVKDVSNFPQLKTDEPTCPIQKGTYWTKNFVADGNNMPAKLPDGHWKAEILVHRNNSLILVVHLYFKSISSKFGFM